MNKDEIMQILPHRDPMLLVDEVILNEDGTATGIYHVRGDEFFLQGHFPDNPIVPGVIQCEIMAQSACILFAEKMKEKGALPVYTGIDKVRFRGMIRPGDTINTHVELKRASHPLYLLHGELTVDGKKCMSGDFSFAITNSGE